jgi:hypothetical protein
MANEIEPKSADRLQMECEAMARDAAEDDLAFLGDGVLKQCVKAQHIAKIREAFLHFAAGGAARTVQKLQREGRLK